jgi:site-specific DNA-methyltransferase (adenine-specific)
MGVEKAQMVFTDPPYGIGLDSSYAGMPSRWASHKYDNKFQDSIVGDDKPFDASWLIGLAKEVFLWGADYYADTLPQSGIKGTWYIWDKREDESGDTFDKMLGSPFEMCWAKVKRGKKFIRMRWASFYQGESTDGEKPKDRYHPTQKPVALAEWFYEKFSEKDEVIFDPYLGSGSFLIACERLGRKCRAVEISPAYCAVAIQRWVDMTGGEPELLYSEETVRNG